MKGYVARKGSRWYAVVYEGVDPISGRERRSWHSAGTERADAERLAARLASERSGRNDGARSLSFGAFLSSRWLPGKRLVLATSTYDGYRRNVERHVLPALGRVGLRQLRPHHLEALYERLLHPSDGRAGLAPKTVYEVHLVIRGALGDAVRRGLVSRNVALIAHAPRLRSIPKVEQQAWTAEELQAFLRAAAGHRLFPALWVSGVHRDAAQRVARPPLGRLRRQSGDAVDQPGNRRSRLRAARDTGEDRQRSPAHRPRSLHRQRPSAWRTWQGTEQEAAGVDTAGWIFTDGDGEPIHPHAVSQTFERIARRARVRVIRLHDLRHTHGTLLIAAGVPVKVVSERLGHASPVFTIDTYQHVLPGMQADAARVFERLIRPGALPGEPSREKTREKRRRKTA